MVSLPFVVSIFYLASANHPEQGVKCLEGDLMVQNFGIVFFCILLPSKQGHVDKSFSISVFSQSFIPIRI